jgi:hypothetical protein
VINTREFIFELIAPVVLSFICYLYIIPYIHIKNPESINGNFLNLLAILIGFSITSLSIISASGYKNIDELKETKSKRSIAGNEITLHQLIVIHQIIALVVELIALTYIIFLLIFLESPFVVSHTRSINTGGLLFGLIITAMNIKNITNFYFVFTKR